MGSYLFHSHGLAKGIFIADNLHLHNMIKVMKNPNWGGGGESFKLIYCMSFSLKLPSSSVPQQSVCSLEKPRRWKPEAFSFVAFATKLGLFITFILLFRLKYQEQDDCPRTVTQLAFYLQPSPLLNNSRNYHNFTIF